MERKASSSIEFPRRNWALGALQIGLVNLAYIITIPSMHQYITTPSADQLAATNTTLPNGFYPGFGRSEEFYTWAVIMYSAGEFCGAIAAPLLARVLPYKYSFLIGILASTVAFLFYSPAPTPWFIMIARFSVGANCGITVPLVSTYLNETSLEVYQMQRKLKQQENGYEVEEKEKISQENPLKDKLFILFTFSCGSGFIFSLGVCSVVALIPGVHPYRWTGWFVIVVSSVLAIVHLIFFKEHKPFKRQKCSSILPNFRKVSLKKGLWRTSRLHIHVFVLVCAYTSSQGYAVLDTLLNPMLSGLFGFTVKYEDYGVLGVAVCLLISSGIFLVLKMMRLNTRKVYITGLVIALIGTLLMTDWQSLGHDPCREQFIDSKSIDSIPQISKQNETVPIENTLCEQLSTDHYQCFWNPNSRVTGHYCPECFRVCRSGQKSLNFIQFSIGLALFSLTVPVLTVSSYMLTTDVTPLQSQVTLMGVNMVMQGIGRLLSPLWLDATYEHYGKRTLVPMAITAVQLAVVLVVFLAMYKQLAPLIHEEESAEAEDEIELGLVGNGAVKYQPLSQEGAPQQENESDSDAESPLLDTHLEEPA